MKVLRYLAALLVAAFLMIPIASAGTMIFDDVSSSHSNAEAIQYLKNEGIVEGYSDGTYQPSRTVNRAEFLKIVMEAYGYDTSSSSYCFSDVKNEWFAGYVCKAKSLGLIAGYSDGYYRPDRDINFAEASKIIVEALELGTNSAYSDNWYHGYVVSLEVLGAIPPSIGNFDESVTRGEMAEMIWRIQTENNGESSRSYDDILSVSSIELEWEGDDEISWVVDGYAENGVKVVWSKESGATYPRRDSGDSSKLSSSKEGGTAFLDAFDGNGTYYVRVCEYTDGACGVYSNEIVVALYSDEAESGFTKIELSDDGNGRVSWDTWGTSNNGFKLVWSLNENPEYPLRDGDHYAYYSTSTADNGQISASDGSGTYFVRVCEYLGGECGLYSNQIEVEL